MDDFYLEGNQDGHSDAIILALENLRWEFVNSRQSLKYFGGALPQKRNSPGKRERERIKEINKRHRNNSNSDSVL